MESAQWRRAVTNITHKGQTHGVLEGLPDPGHGPCSVLPDGFRGEERRGRAGDMGRNLLVLGVEELDEALQEVRTLLHLALPGFEQILGGGQDVPRERKLSPWDKGL